MIVSMLSIQLKDKNHSNTLMIYKIKFRNSYFKKYSIEDFSINPRESKDILKTKEFDIVSSISNFNLYSSV